MNTGGLIKSWNVTDGSETWKPVIWCDICGYGAGSWDDIFEPHHFCHRHKDKEIRGFMSGAITGYFEIESQLELSI